MIPTFSDAELPARGKHPFGPYRKAPAEHGGRWWLVNPFTGEEPWANTEMPVKEALPDGFENIFGPQPRSRGPKPNELTKWKLWLERFDGPGLPAGVDLGPLGDARETLVAWGLGNFFPFIDRTWGPVLGFPGVPDRDGMYIAPLHQILTAVHSFIAQFQTRMLQMGIAVNERHPFTPPQLFEDDSNA